VRTLDQPAVEALYRSGVAAIQTITSSFDEEWGRPACGQWDATDTVRHLVCVADWYHQWLDRALDGDATRPFDESEFETRNAKGVAAFQDLNGPQAVDRFAERTASYLERASQSWNLPYGFPAGTITVGLHVGIAATEWHLHAWDLTAGEPDRHQPTNPAELFLAAGAAMAEAVGGIQGHTLSVMVPLGAKRSPWKTLLKQTGRAA
jgi:uncharacterized protein (TIGR03083 family)